MNALNLKPNWTDVDRFYASLMDLHRGRTAEESEAINTRLILLLANHIGDVEILEQAMAVASEPFGPAPA